MIVLTSPAKTIDSESHKDYKETTLPRFQKEALQLVRILKKKKSSEFQDLMHISENLADLNVKRYKTFKKEFTSENSNPAIYAFRGDVYLGLDADSLSQEEILYSQEHVRILSGLYGLLRPLDMMQAYRLEMGIKLENRTGKNLYEFWGNKITSALNKEVKESGNPYILNLASNEYFKAINTKKLKGKLYTANFKEEKDGSFKFISFNAKKARGMMINYVIKNKIRNPEDLKGFDCDNYLFNPDLSNEREFIFTR